MFAQNYLPSKLSGLVEVISEQRSGQAHSWTFLPDGISCLMFRTNPESKFDIIKANNMGKFNNPSDKFCFITGFSTSPVYVTFDHFEYLGVFLTPIALKTFFGISAQDLRDFAIDGALVLHDLALVEDTLNTLPDFTSKARWLENWLCSKIKESPEFHAVLAIRRLAEKISHSGYAFNSMQLEKFMGYSRAHTHRLFNEWFGLSSQKYQRLMKFVRTMEYMHSSDASLSTIGLNQGYFDQAHFIRTFKEFTDMTPSTYLRNKTNLLAQLPTL